MIQYNNPEYAKERQNVVPLSETDMKWLIKSLNGIKRYFHDSFNNPIFSKLQQLIWRYENLVHNNEAKVPELKRLLAEKRELQKQMDEAMQESWGTNNEPNEYYSIAQRKNEITEQIEKLIEQL